MNPRDPSGDTDTKQEPPERPRSRWRATQIQAIDDHLGHLHTSLLMAATGQDAAGYAEAIDTMTRLRADLAGFPVGYGAPLQAYQTT
jgi:hypothetical protein